MRAKIATLGLAACAVSGCGGDADVPEPVRVTLSYRQNPEFVYGNVARLRGHTTGGHVQQVLLEASPYPFRGYRRVESTTPAKDGRFAFSVRPRRNTRYRAVARGSMSSARTVIVTLRGHFFSSAPGPHTIRVFLTGTGPSGLRARSHTEVFFYLRRRGEPMYQLIGKRPPRVHAANAIRAGGDFDLRPLPGDRFFICPRDGGMAVGFGGRHSPVPGCGGRQLDI